MYTESKILLSIELQGGTLIRESKVTKIEWALTLGDVKKAPKELPEEISSRVVRRGRTKHYNLVAKPAIMAVHLGQDSYDYMTGWESYEPWMRKAGVEKAAYIKKLSKEERLQLHLGRITEHHNGVGFSYQILE